MKQVLQALMVAALLLPVTARADIEGRRAGVSGGAEVCVVDAPGVQQNFREAFLRQLNGRGHATRFVAAVTDCPVVITFTAKYAMSGGYRRVLKISQFRVFRAGTEAGVANYRFSHVPFGNGTVEEVIGKMLDTAL